MFDNLNFCQTLLPLQEISYKILMLVSKKIFVTVLHETSKLDDVIILKTIIYITKHTKSSR